MKNLMSQCPEELVQVIGETYPDYWPLTQEQICYHLFRKVRVSDVAPMGFRDEGRHSFPYNTYLRGFLGLGLNDPPFLTGNRRLDCYTKSDFGSHRRDKYLELWVDDAALAEFLCFHPDWFKGIPVYDAGIFQITRPARETKDRFARMEKERDNVPVVLYLADLDAAGHRRYQTLTDLFGDWADFDRVGLNVEHVSGLLPKPAILCDDSELREDRFFAKELSLPGCYSLSALEPQALIEMICSAVSRHRNIENVTMRK